MTRLDLLLLGALALAARTGAALLVGHPPYLDPAYYELVARQLATGEGFTTPALWSFLEVGGRMPDAPVLPIPSNAHWMPLNSVLAAGSMLIFGTSRFAAQLPMIIAGAALVPLTALVGWELWRSRRVALISGMLALFAGPMLVYLPLTDTFALFGIGGFAAIYGAIRAMRGPDGTGWLLMAGLGVGIATLTRIDGIVLAVAPAVSWLSRRGVGPWRVSLTPLPWSAAVGSGLLATLLIAPWMVRQALVFGTPLPSAGGHTLWITAYNEQFSIGHPIDFGTYLASGLPAIIGSKLESLALLVGRTGVLLGGAFLLSFAYGMWVERRRAELAPLIVYWLTLLIVMFGFFTFHAPKGAWYHSAWAWLPFAIPLSVASFLPATAALGRRWPIFSRERNQRFLLSSAVVGAFVLSLVGSASLLVSWRTDQHRLDSVAAFLAEAAEPSDVVMVVDPPSLTLRTGLRSVAPPFDPYPVIGEVVRGFDVRWVVVERATGAARDPLGLWDGAASTDRDGNAADFLADKPAFEGDDVRIFATINPDN